MHEGQNRKNGLILFINSLDTQRIYTCFPLSSGHQFLTKANTALACCLVFFLFSLVFLDSRGEDFQLVHIYLNCCVRLDKLSLEQE